MKSKKIKIKSKGLGFVLMIFSFVVFGASLFLTLITVASIFEYGASFLFSAFFIVVDILMAWGFFVGMREFTSK